MALFGEKYGDRVRVVSVPGFSMELCGGTHCRATGDIGPFTIASEGGVAAGVRRIEAITGEAAVARAQTDRRTLERVLGVLNAPADRAVETIEKLQSDLKRVARENSQLRVSAAMGPASAPRDEAVEVGGVKVVTRLVADLDKSALRGLADTMREKLGTGVVVLAARDDGKVSVVVSVSKDLTSRVHAGQVVKQIAPIVGGRGGGRPDFAEAGGKDGARVEDMLAEALKAIGQMLSASG
jgi:alanyl-tRNA synthetase